MREQKRWRPEPGLLLVTVQWFRVQWLGGEKMGIEPLQGIEVCTEYNTGDLASSIPEP